MGGAAAAEKSGDLTSHLRESGNSSKLCSKLLLPSLNWALDARACAMAASSGVPTLVPRQLEGVTGGQEQP